MIFSNFYKNIFKQCVSGTLFRNIVPVELRSRSIFNAISSFKNLRKNGFNPSVIIDCGAYEGEWTKEIKRIFPGSKILLIEALPEKEKYLAKIKMEYSNVDYEIALLGARPAETVEFYKMNTGSSVFEEQSNVSRETISLPMKTLDQIVSARKINKISLLKLDVQGSEIEVLKGGLNTLRNSDMVLLECSFLQYNKGAPLFNEVLDFMSAQGFFVYDIGSLFRWKGTALLQADIIFVREDSGLRQRFFNFHGILKNG